jgi:hypothetical protein
MLLNNNSNNNSNNTSNSETLGRLYTFLILQIAIKVNLTSYFNVNTNDNINRDSNNNNFDLFICRQPKGSLQSEQ